MRAFEDEPDVFVVQEIPWGFRAIILAVTGILAWGLYANWGETSWFLRGFMGMFIALLWLIVLSFAHDVTARFDRGAGRVEIVRRRLFGAQAESYSLQDFLGARVEESKDSDGSTFRLILVFSDAMAERLDPVLRARLEKDRQRDSRGLPIHEVPFTSYLSSGSGGPKNAADAINAWTNAAPA